MLRSNAKRLIWCAIIVALGLTAYTYVDSPTAVQFADVRPVLTNETLGASGKVRGARVANVGVDGAGVVNRILVAEGDHVSAGSLILTLDRSELDSRVTEAQNAVAGAEAELSKASRGPLQSEVRQAQAELTQAASVGQARVDQAEARLHDLQSGARTQEIRSAEAQLARSREVLAKAQLDYRRAQQLVKVGAMAQSNLDDARTQMQTAQADVTSQQQNVSLLKSGPRSDQVAEAKASLAEARAIRDTGRASAREKLNTLLAQPRSEDVRSARARVDETRAQLTTAMDAAAKTELRAPFDGVVADLAVERGQSVSPGQTLAVVHEMSKPMIEVETDEGNLSVLSLGQKAVVSSDAYPGDTFDAVVADLGSQVDSDRGTIKVKLRPLRSVAWLRPDMTVDVNVITRRNAKRIILPADTVTRLNRNSVVLVERGGKAVPVRVTTGAAGPDGVVVIGRLRDGEHVVRGASKVTPYGDVSGREH